MLEKIIVMLIIAALYVACWNHFAPSLRGAIRFWSEQQSVTEHFTPEYRRFTPPPKPGAVTCGECRFRDKQAPRLCNHSLGIDVAINPWDSCEYGEREAEQ